MTFTDEELDLDDPDLDIPELPPGSLKHSLELERLLWDKVKDGFDIGIDGAIGYRLRLIPSNKILATGPTVRDVFAAYLEEVDRGRLPRLLVVDWCGADGTTGPVASGSTLQELAQASVHGAKTLPRNRAYLAELEHSSR
jgi:hypothetical protein